MGQYQKDRRYVDIFDISVNVRISELESKDASFVVKFTCARTMVGIFNV